MQCYCFAFIFLLFNAIQFTQSLSKPRGVSMSKLPLYKVDLPFNCLDGSQTSLPWYKVNDDYCDCHDGSDEPGTAACGNGLFYCENKNHRPGLIPSSRVNDAICDCCDGSDEYDGKMSCENTCWELGKAAREAFEEKRKSLNEGLKTYEEIVKQVSEKIADRKTRLQLLEAEIAQATDAKRVAEEAKELSEVPEKEALDKHNSAFEEVKAAWQERHNLRKITALFNNLDTNQDKLVSIEEIQAHIQFDVDQDGSVSEQEAKEYLHSETAVDLPHFKDKVYENIKDIFKVPAAETVPKEDPENIVDEETAEEQEGLLKSEVEEEVSTDNEANDPEPEKPNYDEATQQLVTAATQARKAFDETNEKLRDLEKEKSDITTILERDYGKDSAFFLLADSNDCYELTDREYTYKLCPFRDTTQRPRDSASGYGETNLGRWSKWDTAQLQVYDNGQGCWNGPNRSTRVHIFCGPESKLTSVSEPNRCEYSMDFYTPAACSEALAELERHHQENHEEL